MRRLLASTAGILLLQLMLVGSGFCTSQAVEPHAVMAGLAGLDDMALPPAGRAPEPSGCPTGGIPAGCGMDHGQLPCMTTGACATVVLESPSVVIAVLERVPDAGLPVPHALRSIPRASPDLPPPRA